jgi:nucleoside-diphosphate-sugar epimerase
MKIMFTGATGVLGKASVPLLVADGHDVTGVFRSDLEKRWLEAVGARPARVDLFDPAATSQAMSGMDTVIHFATAIPPQRAMRRRSAWSMNDRLRSTATANLVDAAIANDVERLVQQAITFVYADGGDHWLDESARVEPVWDVLDSALTAESHVERFRAAGGAGVTLRFPRLYGPGKASGDYIASVRNRRVPIIGRGDNFVSSIHVDDAATALARAVMAPAGTYNVTDDAPMRSSDNLRALAEALGAPPPRRVPRSLARALLGKAAAMLTVSHRVSNQAFRHATGWAPAFPSASDGWVHTVSRSPQPE